MIRAALARLGLAARIGVAIVLAVASIQILVTLVVVLNPSAFPPLYSASWLSGAVVDIVNHAMSGQATQDGAPTNDPNLQALAVRIERSPPQLFPAVPSWPLNRVVATVRSELGGGAGVPSVAAAEVGPWSQFVSVVPADAFATLPSGPLESGEDFLAPPTFVIVADLHDGRWLTIAPNDTAGHIRLIQSLAFIFIGTLIVAAIALFTARGLLAPISTLAAAADSLGPSFEIAETPRSAIREFAAIHDAFNAMQGRLKRFVDERTNMLAAISHDLRTPLARLRLQVEFVPDEHLRAGMLANIDGMRDMLAETLSFAQGEATSESSSPFDLASILISLCDEASDEGANVQYEGRNRATVWGRRTAIRRMISNLIDNAARYGGATRVSLDERASEWMVTVADDGPGIPPELIERAFEPFRRLEFSRNRDTGGTGLGLSIARDIALAHGGQIALANASPGGGLVVTVLLPKGVV